MRFTNTIKAFLGTDIKEDKYALVDDPIFGKVAKTRHLINGYAQLVGTVVLDVVCTSE